MAFYVIEANWRSMYNAIFSNLQFWCFSFSHSFITPTSSEFEDKTLPVPLPLPLPSPAIKSVDGGRTHRRHSGPQTHRPLQTLSSLPKKRLLRLNAALILSVVPKPPQRPPEEVLHRLFRPRRTETAARARESSSGLLLLLRWCHGNQPDLELTGRRAPREKAVGEVHLPCRRRNVHPWHHFHGRHGGLLQILMADGGINLIFFGVCRRLSSKSQSC